MYRITTANGRVGHIAGNIVDTADGRVVTTVCGKTHPETDFHVDDTLDPCGACDKKFYNLVDDAVDSYATEKEAAKGNQALAKAAAEVEAELAAASEPVVVDESQTSQDKS